LPELHLTIPGLHNLFNATAALAAGDALEANVQQLLLGLGQFSGSRRRFEHKGTVNGIEVIDDYGHHPTEIRVTLETAKKYIAPGKVIVVFQPHRYSRTQAFAAAFTDSLMLADQAFVLEIYPASEKPIPGVSAQLITRGDSSKKIRYEPSMVDVVAKVLDIATPGDLIMTLGAGDVNSLAPVFIQALEERYA
jgi:UDP-N-acetylmuramate--alanine ligase